MQILSVVFLLITLVLFIPISLSVSVHNKKFVVRLWGVKIFSDKNVKNIVEKDTIKKEEQTKEKEEEKAKTKLSFESFKENLQMGVDLFIQEKENFFKIFKKISVTRCDLSCRFGFENAAVTGMASGLLWTAVGTVVAILNNIFDVKKSCNINITPDFNNRGFDVKFYLKVKTSAWKFLFLIPVGMRLKKVFARYETKTSLRPPRGPRKTRRFCGVDDK